jgi:hypothetical protein
VTTLYVNMSRVVRVEEFPTELALVVSGEMLILNVVDHVVLLDTCFGALQTLIQVDV